MTLLCVEPLMIGFFVVTFLFSDVTLFLSFWKYEINPSKPTLT